MCKLVKSFLLILELIGQLSIRSTDASADINDSRFPFCQISKRNSHRLVKNFGLVSHSSFRIALAIPAYGTVAGNM